MSTKIKITLVLAAISAALAAANGVVLMAEDDHAPVITFPEETFEYSDGMEESRLLEGVTATDDRDGSVEDSLRVGEALWSADKTEVTILYTAKDSSNNVAQASRILPAAGVASGESAGGNSSVSESGTGLNADASDSGNSPAATATPEPTQSADTGENLTGTTGTSDNVNADEAGRQANEAAIALLSAEAPRLYLSQYALTLSTGSDFNALTYVEDIVDDTDSRDDLFRQIQIYGSADTQTPGVYELTYYVNDSDGNRSNEAVLVVTVE